MKRTFCIVLAAAVSLAAWGAPVDQSVMERWDRALHQIASYRTGTSTNGLIEVVNLVQEADQDPIQRQALELRLVTFLESKATLDAKQFICRQLFLIASAQSVPILAGFLRDPGMMDMARYALEAIPSPAVDDALLAALPEVQRKFKIGIINSLGNRRTAKAIPRLLPLLEQPDETIAQAAVGALKKIGGTNVVRQLIALHPTASASVRPLISDALVICADELRKRGHRAEAEAAYRLGCAPGESTAVRAGALRGLLEWDATNHLPFALNVLESPNDPLKGAAAHLISQVPGTQITRAVVARLRVLPLDSQLLVLPALGLRGDAEALPAMLNAIRSEDDAVSVAALKAVGALDRLEVVPFCMEFLAGEKKSAAALECLARLRNPAADQRILEQLPKQAPDVQEKLIDCLAERQATSAIPALLQRLDGSPTRVQASAFRALGNLITTRELPDLVQRIARMENAVALEQAEDAVREILLRTDSLAGAVAILLSQYGEATLPARGALLRMAGQTGDSAALKQVLSALKDNHTELADAAVRVLADWPSSAPADEVLAVIQTTTNGSHRALALRGYVRMAGLASAKSPQTALTMCQQAIKLALTPAEQKLVLSGLAGVVHPDALALAQSCLADAGVNTEAALATVKIARALAKQHPDSARNALQAVVDQCPNEGIRKQAQQALQEVSGKKN